MWKKFGKIAGAVLLVIGLVTSGYVIEDRYENEDHHQSDMKHEEEVRDLKMKNLEDNVVASLEKFQRSSDYKYYSQMLEGIDDQLYKLRQWIRQHPEDQEAREDYQDLKEKRKKIKEKLDSLMDGS